MSRIAPILAALLVFASAALAQEATRPAAKIADVAWLQGYWDGQGMGGAVEDIWMPPRAGLMLGAFRQVKADGAPGFYELVAIEEFEGSLRLVVKHFNPDWVGWEEKDKALMLRLTRISPRELAFGSGLTFVRTADDEFTVNLTIRNKDGTVRHESLRYKKRAL